MQSRRPLSRLARDGLPHLLLTVWTVATIFPLVWIFLQSVKPSLDVFAMPPKWVFVPTLENYAHLFADTQTGFLKYLGNSTLISGGATLLSLTVGTLAAYSLTRFPLPARGLILMLILLFSLIPPIIILLPLYIMWRNLSLLDTHLALIVTFATAHLPFTIWMMRGFLLDLPVELEEAALVDGASRVEAFLRVVLPLSAPGLAATAIFTVLNSWNELLVSQILTAENAKTLAPFISGFVTDTGIYWGRLYAAGSLVLLPVLIFSVMVQKHLVRGFTAGALKG